MKGTWALFVYELFSHFGHNLKILVIPVIDWLRQIIYEFLVIVSLDIKAHFMMLFQIFYGRVAFLDFIFNFLSIQSHNGLSRTDKLLGII